MYVPVEILYRKPSRLLTFFKRFWNSGPVSNLLRSVFSNDFSFSSFFHTPQVLYAYKIDQVRQTDWDKHKLALDCNDKKLLSRFRQISNIYLFHFKCKKHALV